MSKYNVEYLFYNEEGIPIYTSLVVSARSEKEACSTIRSLAFGPIEIIMTQRRDE